MPTLRLCARSILASRVAPSCRFAICAELLHCFALSRLASAFASRTNRVILACDEYRKTRFSPRSPARRFFDERHIPDTVNRGFRCRTANQQRILRRNRLAAVGGFVRFLHAGSAAPEVFRRRGFVAKHHAVDFAHRIAGTIRAVATQRNFAKRAFAKVK